MLQQHQQQQHQQQQQQQQQSVPGSGPYTATQPTHARNQMHASPSSSLEKPMPPPPQSPSALCGHHLAPDMDQRRGQTNGGRPVHDSTRVYEPNQPLRELFLRVRIQSIEKAKKDLLVRFDAVTNLPHFRSSSYSGITRSYREMCLYSLALSLSSPATIVPALPLPSTTASGLEDTRILRLMLSRWFSRVLAEPNLRDHTETRNFMEADFAYSPTPPGAGSSSAARKRFANAMASAASVAFGGVDASGGLPNGVLATSASASSRAGGGGLSILGLGSSSKGLSTSRSVYDDDEDLVAARAEVTRLEMQFADAAEASEKLAHARRALMGALTDASMKLNNLGAVEEVRPPSARLGLPYVLKRSAYMCRSVGELQDALSNTELLTLGDAVAYQSINARAAKEAMLARNALVEEHHNAQKATVAKKRDAEHLKTQRNLRADRVDDALEDLEEAKRHEFALAQNLKKISAELHGSLQSHSRYAHQDLQQALIEHARGSIMYSRQMLKELKALKADLEGKPHPPSHSGAAIIDAQKEQRNSNSSPRPSTESSANRSEKLQTGQGSPRTTAPAEHLPRSESFGVSGFHSAPPRSDDSLPTSPVPVAVSTAAASMSRSGSGVVSPSPMPSMPGTSNANPGQGPSVHHRPNVWQQKSSDLSHSVHTSHPHAHLQQHQQAPGSSSPSLGVPVAEGGSATSQSMFLDRPRSNPFGTLNSGTGTASGRSRISAAEAARSLAGRF
ncbi:hypothetical protein BCV70DRAFT_197619 [Testicularia cyperi]|uniref:Sorting nexin/Vps5-like C-terminal domain-containing protein n=1 Tax=Testicularia cyperi TaxID=1882483 RepID=A0A317XZS5_9BASI|nr:hypothetical protein BCV70DRAFT_197619 [Testicularia cyperi]